MRINRLTIGTVLLTLFFAVVGCAGDDESGESQEPETMQEAGGEHEREGAESGREEGDEHEGEERSEHSEEGEESGTMYGLGETYDQVRNGARLILSYDADSNTFTGTVENTTERTIEWVRIEVHLSNGIELGPTTPTSLRAGETVDVTLQASSTDFERWNAHAEVGSGEHEEEDGEHEEGGGDSH